MERWQMNRFGFVNFWVYDLEEFQTEDGKILIRGSNGSGKSITTQSFIPYILDGDRQPTRLDPFGSRDRKMEFYLIGDQDSGKDESTGYIWMEFIKPASNQYRTIGIGLHAKKGGKMNTWGFCITDGRRMGEDFFLYQQAGDQIIPLDAKALKKELGEQNSFTDKPTEYKAIVAGKIFGISKEKIDDFDQLTNILIKTRSSKLASKENLRPAQLYSILNESLRTLSDEDLHPMSDAMSKIEDAHSKIENSLTALKEAEIITEQYDRYNRYMLWKKAKVYLQKNNELKSSEDEYEAKQNDISNAKEKIEKFTELSEKVQQKLTELMIEERGLDITDITEHVSRKKANEDRLAQAKKNETDKLRAIEAKKDIIRRKYVEQNEEKNKLEFADAEIKKYIQELSDYEEDVFPFYHRFLTTLQKEDPLTREQYSDEYKLFREKLAASHDLIKKYENNKDEYRQTKEKLAFLDDVYHKAVSSLKEAERQFDEQKDEAIERLYTAANNNQEYIIDTFMRQKAEKLIAGYEGSGSANDYMVLLNANKLKMQTTLNELLVRANIDREKAKDNCDKLEEELEELKNTSEPVPDRSEQKKTAREALKEHGIPYHSFYECVDFRSDIPEEVRVIIEAELTDSGLLDALIIPEEHKKTAEGVLSGYADSYILPEENWQAGSSKYFEVITDDSFRKETDKILSSLENNVILSADGYYLNGILGGHSTIDNSAGFIGAERRKKYREKLISDLEEKLSSAKKIYDDAGKAYNDLQERINILDEEYHKMADISDLNTALNLLFGEKHKADNAKNDYEEQLSLCDRKKIELDVLYKQIDESCKDFPYYEKTSSTFAEIMNDVDHYISLVCEAANQIFQKQTTASMIENINETIEDAENDKDILSQELTHIITAIRNCEASIRICDEFLTSPENIDKTKRLEEIQRQIDQLTSDKQTYEKNITENETRLKIYSEDIEKKLKKRIRLIEEESRLAAYFEEELELGFVLQKDSSTVLKQYAEEALSVISPDDMQKSITDIFQKLNNTYRKNSNVLSSEYHPMYETLYENSGSDVIRSRVCITLVWQGKQVAPAFFREELRKSIEHDKSLLRQEEENMFKEILLNTISKKLSNRIRESNEWLKTMSELMANINTSMGLTFRLVWTPKKDLGENELPFEELNKLLAKDKDWISAEDIDRLTGHFRSKIEYERKLLEENGENINYSDIMRNVLDFRNWFEFRLQYKDPKMSSYKELTNSRFNTFSGGERALSLYIPLFAAVSAQYEKAGDQAPRILALDEAFAGVDESNISEMFALLERLDFGYIVNSQALWGCYDTVPSLGIAELFHDKNSDFITVIKYKWNGKQKILAE